MPLLGAKEGLAHLALAQLDPGDVALVADPGYPVYVGGPLLAGAEPVRPAAPARARGSSPTSTPCRRRCASARTCSSSATRTTRPAPSSRTTCSTRLGVAHGVPICHDNAYSEITFDGYVAPSFLATPGAREAGIEILSLSKAFSLPGWRIAFAVGNAAMVGNLLRLKTNVDAGMFDGPAARRDRAARQRSGRARARSPRVYERRRDLVCDALARGRRSGVDRPRGGMYVWLPVPGGERSLAFSRARARRVRRRRLARQRLRRRRRGVRAARADPARRPPGRGHRAA